ncbi:hypothetical protein N7494_004306 [Penicillium frequentans]|uniref:Uncharacterized protein n=1 Tax=Penicillium frequentans TaxID=3151616 RepID=A0AAD6GIB0_9EURO|nr:hypothetical protein N7494_004306 [Penicillium glabrum]
MAMPGIFQRHLDEPTLTTEAKFWPGGIPSFIKSPTENFNVEPCDFPPTVKGWYRFVRENWVSSDDETDDSKAQQRRSLIETWVTAQQDFRDTQNSDSRRNKLVPWDLYLTADAPKSSTNWALWLKIQLMFYDYNRMWGHVAKETFTITPKKNDFVTLDNIKRYQGLETADFGILAFNNVGEAEQDPMDERIYFDDEALDMRKPLLEILLTESEEQEVDDDEVEDALIELAPGYVEAEAEGDGLAEGFDLFGLGFQSILLT